MAIEFGTDVEVIDAFGERVRMKALGPPGPGRDFTVVMVCTEDEWLAGVGEEESIPWPAEYVELVPV
jgi:hypothetical protein